MQALLPSLKVNAKWALPGWQLPCKNAYSFLFFNHPLQLPSADPKIQAMSFIAKRGLEDAVKAPPQHRFLSACFLHSSRFAQVRLPGTLEETN